MSKLNHSMLNALRQTRSLLLILPLTLACIFVLPKTAPAEQEVLRVAFNEFPPWKIFLQDGSFGGIDIDILKAMAERMHFTLAIHNYPFKRGLAMLEAGEIDLSTSLLRRPDREPFLLFITPPYTTETNKAFYVLKGNEHLVRKYEDLAKLRIGTLIGVKYFPRFDNDTNLNKSAVNSFSNNSVMLLNHRIHTFIYTEAVGDYLLAHEGLNDRIVKAPFKYTEKQDVFMALSRESLFARRLNEFNQVMQQLLEEGVVDRIKAKYIKP